MTSIGAWIPVQDDHCADEPAPRRSWYPRHTFDGIFTTCPSCRLPGHHVFEWRETPGVHATWPDPMAPHWWRQCLTCRHEWDEHEEDAS